MKKLIALLIVSLVPGLALAASGNVHLDKANIDLENKASLQRGAKFYANYCMGCHATGFHRYNRMAKDLGMPEAMVQKNLIFTADFSKNPQGEPTKIGSLMTNAMPKDKAKAWFGTPPPDLTLVARVRGTDWLYTYLRSFYLDGSRPFGVNNTVFKNVGMPHVLWELQGWQEPVFKYEVMHDGHAVADFESKAEAEHYVSEHGGDAEKAALKVHETLAGLKLVKQGTQTPEEYERTVRDLVNYLAYMGEPVQLERKALGVWVLLFLVILFVLAYYLKKEYWKDVH